MNDRAAPVQASLVRDRLGGATILTIAHRETGLAWRRPCRELGSACVSRPLAEHHRRLRPHPRDAGRVSRGAGPPALLLVDASSYFCRIASEMGPEEMAALRAQANYARA